MWDFVMTLATGIDQFGRTDPKRDELYDLAAQQTGLAVTTLRTYVSAARSPVASLAIEKDLSFQHARAVLGLSEDVADSLLSDAVANGWSAERLSQKAWVKRNGPPSQRTLTGNNPPPAANGIAPCNGYRATDDIDDRAECLAASPAAYDHSDNVPFSHGTVDDAGPVADLWSDERIAQLVDGCACDVEYTDADGLTHTRQYVLAEDVQRLLRTMRDEFQLFA